MDNLELLVLPILVAIATRLMAVVYCRWWRRSKPESSVPTGFGVFLPLFLCLTTVFFDDPVRAHVAAGVIILVSTVAYWVDDAKGLSPAVRVGIAFFCGAMLGAVTLGDWSIDVKTTLVMSACAGVACVVLANIVNFYDGADLNLATLIAVAAMILSTFSPMYFAPSLIVGLAMLGFAVGFGTVNRRPATLYLGDAGSFAVAAILTWFAAQGVPDLSGMPVELLCALALPAFDVFYVLLIRIRNRHDLLSRNHLHLYQRLQIRFGGRSYLLPQALNGALMLAVATFMQGFGMHRWLSVIIAAALVTPVFYLYCRRRWVEPEFFFGDGKSS